MALSSDIVSQFAKIVTLQETKPVVTTVTGKAVSYQGILYVQLDGSDQLTPIASSTAGIKDGDRVTVQIKNHSVTITGNMSSPSAGKDDIDDINGSIGDMGDQITEFEIAIGNKVDVIEFDAVKGRVDTLEADNVTIKDRLTATEANIGKLEADNVTINEKLTAAEAEIDNLTATKADISVLEAEYATIENLEATNANIHDLQADYADFKQVTSDNITAVNGSITNLETNKLDAESADIRYAKIDFANIGEAAVEELFAKSGIIGDLVVSEGHITGHLVGVTISGDLIEGNTIKADKLVVLGEDGLYYKLNVGAETVAASQTEYNSLNGSIITANTITAEKINVDDLVAFNATIGGFKIGESSIYSGVKSSVDNTTPGVYMDSTGQIAIGDSSNYFKFFQDTDGTWKLDLSANAITIATTGKTLEDTISDIQNGITNLEGQAQDFSQKIIELDATNEAWTLNFKELNGFISNEDGEFSASVENAIFKYIKFQNGEIWLGKDKENDEEADFKCVISNNRISFLQDGSEVAYISNNQLYITNATVKTRLDIGGFSFMPRENGNLTFKYVGE